LVKIAALLSIAVLAAMMALSATPVGFAAENAEEENTSSSLTVGIWVDITLSKVPIAWGTLTTGTENNLANADAGNPATVTVESTTNTNVDIYIKGTDWTYLTNTLGADNCTYDDDNTLGEGEETGLNEKTLATTYDAGPNQGYFEDVTPGTAKNTYWFIDIPASQAQGSYTSTVYFKAVKDGNTP